MQSQSEVMRKLLLIIILLHAIGCTAGVGYTRIVSVTSGQNTLVEVYGPYFPNIQGTDLIIAQYKSGELRTKQIEEDRLFNLKHEYTSYINTNNRFYKRKFISEYYYKDVAHTELCTIWLLSSKHCDAKPNDMYMLIGFDRNRSCYAIVSTNDKDELKSTANMDLITKQLTQEKTITLEIFVDDGKLCK
jgi:hypothetical protein